ncbi:MAG: hypothetical protein WBG46_04725 [Nonlabens sp.]
MSNAKSKVSVLVLLVLTCLSTGFAIYYGSQVSDLKEELATQKSQESKVNQETTHASDRFRTVDSLILEKNYQKAADLSRELKSNISVDELKSIELRYTMANAIVKRENELQQLRELNLNEPISDSISTEKDSLLAELNKAQATIYKLRKQAQSDPATNYLDFETTKGTELHYVGAVKNGKANGYGIAILDSGSRYEGTWKDNMRHGSGKFLWDDGQRYEGDYVDDKREGTGTYYWENGSKYVGEWKADRRNGRGKYYNRRGKLKDSGIWKDDQLVEED